mmetsp:Transcript_44775/g.54824  ORF Transcript_44775/g.54824 Transcript_44775/m.54824 type:complete len:167 (+) Transcript_44775:284-784(+)
MCRCCFDILLSRKSLCKHKESCMKSKTRKYIKNISKKHNISSITTTKITKKIVYICGYNDCNKAFNTKKMLNSHQRIHDKKIICLQCNKKFRDKWDLKMHQNTHKKHKIYACNHLNCNSKFHDSNTLRNHKNYCHHLIKRYKCKFCKWKSFKKQLLLNKHLLRHHS